MCGIVGIIDKQLRLFGIDMDKFEDMLVLDSLRGKDSTGAFCVYTGGQSYWTKQATNPHTFLDNKDWDKFREKACKSGGIVIGHNRKATIGDIITKNAHPFAEGNIILVHNGGITNHKSIGKEHKSEADVDSQVIAKALNSQTPDELFPTLYGAFSFVWYDKRSKTLNLFRNKERPLWLAETAGAYYIASEPYSYLVPLGRSGSNKPDKQFEISPETLYTFSLKEKKFTSRPISLTKLYSNVTYTESEYWQEYAEYQNDRPLNGSMVVTEAELARRLRDIDRADVEKAAADAIASAASTLPPDHLKQATKSYKDDVVIHNITKVYTDTLTGRVKINGVVVTPGKERVDIISLTPMVDLVVANKFFKKDHQFFISKVKNVADHSSAGVSLWVHETKPVQHVEDFDGKTWPVAVGADLFVTQMGRCKKCKKIASSTDIPFSRVSNDATTPEVNRYQFTCPDCVMASLPKDKQDEFLNSYASAVPDGKPVMPSVSNILQ